MNTKKQSLSSTQMNLIVDSIIFIAFLVVMAPHFTGMAIHEWLGISFGSAIITHLLLHWNWIVTTTQRIFSRLPSQTRINHALNLLLFIDITLLTFTGIMISESALPLLGIELAKSGIWHMVHTTTANVALGLIGLHVALHWQWVVSSFQHYVIMPLFGKVRVASPLPTVKTVQKGMSL